MNREYNQPSEYEMSTELEGVLLERLPDMATKIISKRPQNESFFRHPDDPAEHDVNWHQFGIITHTRRVSQAYHNEVPQYLEQWGVADDLNKYLNQTIDGKTKRELFAASIPLHDVGKFASEFKPRLGRRDHAGHEARSADIIHHNGYVQQLLQQQGLSEQQIQYIAQCARFHYKLGDAREVAKSIPLGYSLAFAESEACQTAAEKIAQQHPDFKTEIGLYFLTDSLGKIEARPNATSDDEINQMVPMMNKQLEEAELNPQLINAMKQLPVNIAVARKYLKTILK